MANEAMMDISNKKKIFSEILVVNLTVKVAGINVLSDCRDQGQLAIELTCESEPDAKALTTVPASSITGICDMRI